MAQQGQIGFGCYRISIRSEEHKEALTMALEKGCTLIDTSANYTDGESELLIGKVLKENSQFKPLLVTKAGYIQGKNLEVLEDLHKEGKAKTDLVDLGNQLKHSIHPEFLENQIQLSLDRLQVETLPVFLLHNPEYYFQTEGANQEEYLRRIKLAFEFLEEKVTEGKIQSYGISSNNFILDLEHPQITDLEKIFELVENIPNHHFKYIQFPLNLVENGAMKKQFGEMNLIEKAKSLGLITLSNRPLNAFGDNGLIRLASYENTHPEVDLEESKLQLQNCLDLLKPRLEAQLQGPPESLPLVRQILEIWGTLPSPDAVEQVFFGHFFPFIAKVWGGNGLTPKESQPFYELFEMAMNLSRQYMTQRGKEFLNQAIEGGLLPTEAKKDGLAIASCKVYLDWGVDYVLVGMKKKDYVNQLSSFF